MRRLFEVYLEALLSHRRTSGGRASPGLCEKAASEDIRLAKYGMKKEYGMPLVHKENFALRIHECDAYGHLNHVHYFHFMQQVAYTACSTNGWDRQRFQDMGMLWVIRTSNIDYRKPILFGSTITVETWVATVRQSRSIRRYLFLNEEGEVCADAMSEWILLDLDSGLPKKIGPEFIKDFYESGESSVAAGETDTKIARFELGPRAAGAHVLDCRVDWRDLDLDWRVNNAVYVDWTEACGLDILAAYGWPFTRQIERGFGIVARRYEIEYLLPAVPGDKIETVTWVSAVRRVSAERSYLITRTADNACLARAKALWAWVSLRDGSLIPLPDDFYADFKKNFSDGIG